MSLPRFIDRAADAALPLLSAGDRVALISRLERTVPAIRIDEADSCTHGMYLAVNLAARLYPRLVIEAPPTVLDECVNLAKAINPAIEFTGEVTHRLAFAAAPVADATVTVFACGWNVSIDGGGSPSSQAAAAPAALAAGAIGCGDLFRAVFADWLPRGRTDLEPGSFNLITLAAWSDVPVPNAFDLGRVHLAGVGAIGQATLLTLAASAVQAELVVVDPEPLELSNLQRYVLSYDRDVGKRKVDIAARAAAGKLRVGRVASNWGATSRSKPGRDVVLVGLDSGRDRIGVQAGLHRRLYNAFTQPSDLGWSRHEDFGNAPCLACLYWPRGKRPHRYQSIARSLDQPELRVRMYLASGLSVGLPLPTQLPLPAVETPPSPEEIQDWQTTPLIRDLAPRYSLDDAAISDWSSRSLDELYREAICGGAFVHIDNGTEVLVPLAHQSALAGVMLAVQALAASAAKLRAQRPSQIEARLDMLRRLPASFELPQTERAPGCICSDGDFVSAFRKRR